MSDYDLTPLARDVFQIWAFIADDNEDAADRLEQAIYDACEFVSVLDAHAVSQLHHCLPA